MIRRVTQVTTYPDQYRDADNRLMAMDRPVRRLRRYAIHLRGKVEYRDCYSVREAMDYVESKFPLRRGWSAVWETVSESDWIGFYVMYNHRGKPQRSAYPIGIRLAARMESNRG
jgi:hypothetical protein